MKSLIIACLLSSIVFGQTLIHSGSPDDAYFSPANTCAPGGSCAYTDATVLPATLRYGYGGTPVQYDIPAPMGLGVLYLGFYEPNKTNVGQRVFTVSINGGPAITLDIFKLAGGNKKYWALPAQAVVVTDGFVHIVYTSKNGANPLTAITDYKPNLVTGPVGPAGPQGIQGVPGNDGKNGVMAMTVMPGGAIKCMPATTTSPGITCTSDPKTNTMTVQFTPQLTQ